MLLLCAELEQAGNFFSDFILMGDLSVLDIWLLVGSGGLMVCAGSSMDHGIYVPGISLPAATNDDALEACDLAQKDADLM